MPIQYTGQLITPKSDALQSLALEFASLTRQAKSEKSHAYAAEIAQSVSLTLFTLAMATTEEIANLHPPVDNNPQDAINLCKRLGVMANEDGRTHNWVRSICFIAINLLQTLYMS